MLGDIHEKHRNEFVRLLWCDLAGMRRCRLIPGWRHQDACDNGVSATKAIMALNAFEDGISPDTGLTALGAIDIRPDTCHTCPWHPNHKLAHVSFQDGPETWDCSPRDQLRILVEKLSKNFGLRFQLGQEIEFCLLDARKSLRTDELPPPLDRTYYAQSMALNTGSADVLDDICAALVALGVKPEQYHPESGPGQFELVLPHYEGVEAADAVIFARETISAIAAKHGMIATFLPKPYPNKIGSAAHTHLSIWTAEGINITSHETDDERGKQFLAGVLHHLPALCIFIAPSPASYDRIKPGTWSGAFKCWGIEHKEAALRFCPGASSKNTNFEVKGSDNTNNPYICFASLITAGMQGILHGMTLPDPCTISNPAEDTSLIRLPENIDEALAAFKEDAAFARAMDENIGKALVTAYLGVRAEEARVSRTMTADEQLSQLLHRY